MVTSRVLVDVHRKLAFAQLTAPEGQLTYKLDATCGDVFARVHRAVVATNARLERRRNPNDTDGALGEFARLIRV